MRAPDRPDHPAAPERSESPSNGDGRADSERPPGAIAEDPAATKLRASAVSRAARRVGCSRRRLPRPRAVPRPRRRASRGARPPGPDHERAPAGARAAGWAPAAAGRAAKRVVPELVSRQSAWARFRPVRRSVGPRSAGPRCRRVGRARRPGDGRGATQPAGAAGREGQLPVRHLEGAVAHDRGGGHVADPDEQFRRWDLQGKALLDLCECEVPGGSTPPHRPKTRHPSASAAVATPALGEGVGLGRGGGGRQAAASSAARTVAST